MDSAVIHLEEVPQPIRRKRLPEHMAGDAGTQQVPEVDYSPYAARRERMAIEMKEAEATVAGIEAPLLLGHPEKLTDKQLDVLELLSGPQRHTCIVGGSRSGKTTLIVRAIIIRALYAKSRHVILRLRSNAVWPSIGMDTFPKVMSTFFPGIIYHENKALHYFEFDNGSQIWLGGLDDKERAEKILGNEYTTIFFNECSQIPYSTIVLALSRLAENVPGLRQRAIYDLNPSSTRHWTNLQFGDLIDPVSRRPLDDPEEYKRMFMNPKDNAANLTRAYLKSLDNMPERQRKRFRDGAYVDEADNTLWKIDTLARCRKYSDEIPRLLRIVVAVDPSGAANEFDIAHDAIGIVVAGMGDDGHAYVLGDFTLLAGPDEWGRKAISCYHRFHANQIIAEINFGGAMVEMTMRAIDQSVPFKSVTASRGKTQRADPVAALYEQGKVHHVMKRDPTHLYGSDMSELEEELSNFTTMGYIGPRSPNRADACIWALSELMLQQNASGWLGFFEKQAKGGEEAELPEGITLAEVMRMRNDEAIARDRAEWGNEGIIVDPATRLAQAFGEASPTPAAPPPPTFLVAPSPHYATVVNDGEGRNKHFSADANGHLKLEPADLIFVPALLRVGFAKP